jgi:hypothetical protein
MIVRNENWGSRVNFFCCSVLCCVCVLFSNKAKTIIFNYASAGSFYSPEGEREREREPTYVCLQSFKSELNSRSKLERSSLNFIEKRLFSRLSPSPSLASFFSIKWLSIKVQHYSMTRDVFLFTFSFPFSLSLVFFLRDDDDDNDYYYYLIMIWF